MLTGKDWWKERERCDDPFSILSTESLLLQTRTVGRATGATPLCLLTPQWFGSEWQERARTDCLPKGTRSDWDAGLVFSARARCADAGGGL